MISTTPAQRILVLSFGLSFCGAPETPRSPSQLSSQRGQSISLEYEELNIQFPIQDAFVLTSTDSLIVSNTHGRAHKLNPNRDGWTDLFANVDVKSIMLTYANNSFWELYNQKIHYANSDVLTADEIAVTVYSSALLDDMTQVEILGFSTIGVIIQKEGNLYCIQISNGQLIETPLILPRPNLTALSGGLSRDESHVWIYTNDGLVWVAELSTNRIDHWTEFKLETDMARFNYVNFILSMGKNQRLTIHTGYFIHNQSVFITSKQSQSQGTESGTPNEEKTAPPSDRSWNSVIKPIFDNACASCHSGAGGYASESSWLLNKCSILSRIQIANKANAGTMPPTSASAPLSYFNANSDYYRNMATEWLSENGSACP